MTKYFIIGGAGFIGSNIAKKLISDKRNNVTVYDNFSSGSIKHIKNLKKFNRFKLIKGDVKDFKKLNKSIIATDIVIHTAANPDISLAVKKPDIDFWEGTFLTNNVLEAMRQNQIRKIIYTSGSGVYGENTKITFNENYGPCIPISTYGASKLACESLIHSYAHMFGIQAVIFRFANVVGPMQTHGVGFDFINKLKKNNEHLHILGNGKQKKSYIHIDDIFNAIIKTKKLFNKSKSFSEIFNVATDDYITVNEIANITIKKMNCFNVKVKYSGGLRGWKGDVPIISLCNKKIKTLGWKPLYNSKEAISKSIESMLHNEL